MNESLPSRLADAATQPGELMTPVELANRVAILTDADSTIQAGDLPLWHRLSSQRGSSLSRLFWIVCWCATVGLMLAAILRVVAHDGSTLLVWVNAFTAYVYLPAYVILVAALWSRRWALAVLSAAIVACHLAWLAPDFAAATPYSAAADSATPKLRVFYANVLASNTEYEALFEEIEEVDADIVVLAEYRHHLVPLMRAAPVMKKYPFGTDIHARYAGEVAVFSRLPVSRQQLVFKAGRLLNVVDVPIGDLTLRIIALHSHRPLMETPDLYSAYWSEVIPFIEEQAAPLVVIGDFNATQHSRVYSELKSSRMRSAHTDRGRGFAVTWPNGRWPLPPIRIDHALLSPEVECVSIAEGTGAGSDHKPLILEVRLHPPESVDISSTPAPVVNAPTIRPEPDAGRNAQGIELPFAPAT